MSEGAYYVFGGIKGGKSFRDSARAIVDRVNSPRLHVLYLGAACDNDPSVQSSFENGMNRLCPDQVFMSLALSPFQRVGEKEVSRDYIAEQFETADIVFFDGGDVPQLSEVFDRFRLKDYCRDAYERGAFVGGLCAGGSILAEHVVFSEEEECRIQRGVGLIKNTTISCQMDNASQYDMRYFHLHRGANLHEEAQAIGLGDNQVVLFNESGIGHLSTTFQTGLPFCVKADGSRIDIGLFL